MPAFNTIFSSLGRIPNVPLITESPYLPTPVLTANPNSDSFCPYVKTYPDEFTNRFGNCVIDVALGLMVNVKLDFTRT